MFLKAKTLLPLASAPGIGNTNRLLEISVSILREMLTCDTGVVLSARVNSGTKFPQSICRPASNGRPPRRSGAVAEKTWILPVVLFSS